MKNHEKSFGWLVVNVILFTLAMAFLVVVLAHSQNAWGQEWSRTIGVEWDANPEPDMKQYQLYMNGELVDTIPHPTLSTVVEVTEPGEYVFTLTAVDFSLNESGPSLPASITLDATAPEIPNKPDVTITITTTTTVTTTVQ